MPQKAPRPLSLVPGNQTRELRGFPEIYQREIRAIPEQMTITIHTTTETARNYFTLDMPEKNAVPNTPSEYASQEPIVSFLTWEETRS